MVSQKRNYSSLILEIILSCVLCIALFRKKIVVCYLRTTNFPLKILQFSHPNNQILYLSEPGLKSAAVCREPLLLTSMSAMHYKKAWLVYTCTSLSLPSSVLRKSDETSRDSVESPTLKGLDGTLIVYSWNNSWACTTTSSFSRKNKNNNLYTYLYPDCYIT